MALSSEISKANEDAYDDGYLRVEHENYYVACNGKPINNLTRKEFLVLSRLVRGEGRAVAYGDLWEYAWGAGTTYRNLAFRVCVSSLRHKLEAYGIAIIPQVHFGYRLERRMDTFHAA